MQVPLCNYFELSLEGLQVLSCKMDENCIGLPEELESMGEGARSIHDRITPMGGKRTVTPIPTGQQYAQQLLNIGTK